MKRILPLLALVLAAVCGLAASELRTIGLPATQELVTVPVDAQGVPVNPPPSWVPLVKLEKPAFDAMAQTCYPVLTWHADRVERGWTVGTLPERKQAQLAIAAGYTVQPEGFVLSLSKADRNSFTQMLLLVRLLKDGGQITDSTPQKIADKSGVLHEVTTARFLQIMTGYGIYFKTKWDVAKSEE